MTEKNNSQKNRLETNQILSSRKRIEEILRFMIQDSNSRLTRTDIQNILEWTNDAKTAKDFFASLGTEISEGDEYAKLYEDFQSEKQLLQDLGVNIIDLFRLNQDGKFEFSSQYDEQVQRSLLKMAHLEKEINEIGTESKYVQKKRNEETTQVITEETEINHQKQKIANMFKKRREEISYNDIDDKNISPKAQQVVRGITQYEELNREKNEAVDNNYFDWYASNLLYLHKLRKSLIETKSLVITKGLEKVIEEVRDTKNQTNKPAFVQGDLGCGKTEVALHVGRENNRQNLKNLKKYYESEGYTVVSTKSLFIEFSKISEKEKKELADFVYDNFPNEIAKISKETDEAKLKKDILNNKDLLFKAFQTKKSQKYNIIDEELIIEPIVLSGHKEFDPAQFIGGFEIRQSEVDPLKLTEIYSESISKITEAIENDPKLKDEEKKTAANDMKDMLKAGLSNKGIETHAYLGKLLDAMKVGKTVIIDEVNAIPHEVLIILNHYLTRKPGDIITPPINSLPPFEIAKGFEVILTGNVPKDGQSGYIGRQSLDAAFLSRLNIVNMDYLNNARENDSTYQENLPPKYINELKNGIKDYNTVLHEYYDSLSNEDKAIIRRGGNLAIKDDKNSEHIFECKGKENDELFHVLAVFGLPRSYVGNLPEEYFDKLYQLARVSRLIQDAFSGQQIDKKYYGQNSKKPQSFLKNAVPSMRHLTNIIKAWKADGYSRDLDFYLWKFFIQQQSGEEKKWVYQMFKEFGGFFKAEIFEEHEANLDLNLQGRVTKDELVEVNDPKFKTFSQAEILEKLFGPAPRIDEKTAEILDSVKLDNEDLEKEKSEMIAEIDANIFLMQEFIDDYEERVMKKYCADQCEA